MLDMEKANKLQKRKLEHDAKNVPIWSFSGPHLD